MTVYVLLKDLDPAGTGQLNARVLIVTSEGHKIVTVVNGLDFSRLPEQVKLDLIEPIKAVLAAQGVTVQPADIVRVW